MTNTPLIWKGKTLRTTGDIGAALEALESREEAHQFMSVYSALTVHAYANVGYIAGYYYDHDTMHRILDWCETSHPIFGRTDPTPEQAFEAGQRMIMESNT